MMPKNKILRRLESGERWWAAEIILRAFGLAMLGLCVAVSVWLYGAVHQPPPHEAGPLEFLAALVSVTGWSLGWSFLAVGPGLFKLVPVRRRRGSYSITFKNDGENR
jgi:hypothetical protein